MDYYKLSKGNKRSLKLITNINKQISLDAKPKKSILKKSGKKSRNHKKRVWFESQKAKFEDENTKDELDKKQEESKEASSITPPTRIWVCKKHLHTLKRFKIDLYSLCICIIHGSIYDTLGLATSIPFVTCKYNNLKYFMKKLDVEIPNVKEGCCILSYPKKDKDSVYKYFYANLICTPEYISITDIKFGSLAFTQAALFITITSLIASFLGIPCFYQDKIDFQMSKFRKVKEMDQFNDKGPYKGKDHGFIHKFDSPFETLSKSNKDKIVEFFAARTGLGKCGLNPTKYIEKAINYLLSKPEDQSIDFVATFAEYATKARVCKTFKHLIKVTNSKTLKVLYSNPHAECKIYSFYNSS